MDKNRIEGKLEIVKGLSGILADSYVLGLKTQNFHWNVKGKSFYHLHQLFEDQYTSLFEHIDVIAERISALGYRVPGSLKEFTRLASIMETESELNSHEMIKELEMGYQKVKSKLYETIKISEAIDDYTTTDVLSSFMSTIDKNQWVLSSISYDDKREVL